MQRVVLLGASNLTLAFPLLIESLRHGIDGPVEIVAAHGHGRSYGMWSRVLFRTLPGISSSRLWSDMEERTEQPEQTLAILTDVGNDLLYGADVPTISRWVETCLSRLSEQQAEIVMTLLPLDSILSLSVLRYHVTKKLFFPRSGVSWPMMQERVRALNDVLGQLGEKYNATTIEPQGDWYGFDPIHIRRCQRRAVWQEILKNWTSLNETFETVRPFPPKSVKLWRLRPAERGLFGRRQTGSQPVIEFDDGTTLWLY